MDLDTRKRQLAEYQQAYYETNKERLYKQRRVHRKANKEQLSEGQGIIATARKARGWTQLALAKMLRVSKSTVTNWELGVTKANWPKLIEIMPELAQEIKAPPT